MNKTNFEKVIEFNNTFGITVHENIQQNIFDDDPKLIKYRIELIREEVKELAEAIDQKNFKEVIDALSDILYVVYGMGCSIGSNLDETFRAIYGDDRPHSNCEIVKIKYEYNSKPLYNDLTFVSLKNNGLYDISNELEKLEKYVANKQFLATTIVLTRLLYYSYRTGLQLGVDMDEAFRLVHESNMSKLCSSEEEAKQTVQWYKDNEDRYDSPSYRLSEDGKYWVVYNKSTKKILKSIKYHPVDLSPVCCITEVATE